MSKPNDKFKVEYNDAYDVLYITLKNSYGSYVEERVKGILINHDFITDEIVGIEIWDFKKRIENKEEVLTPFPVDFDCIIKTITQ